MDSLHRLPGAQRVAPLLALGLLALQLSLVAAFEQPASVQPHHIFEVPDDYLTPTLIEWTDLVEARSSAARQLLQQEPETDTRRQTSRRCRMARGDWCGQFERQQAVPTKPPPRGDKPCPKDCNGVGNCNYDSGKCDCPAGWQGEDCATVLKRPCTNRYRTSGSEPTNHTDIHGRDLDWTEHGWMAGRCPGICDDSLAMCYCDNPKFGHIAAPAGSPPGTPPLQIGRMLGDQCMPKTTWDKKPTTWGNSDYERLYGETGWCNATHPVGHCGCILDGHFGNACETMAEQMCPNQCGGRGACHLGFCKCYPGWYGTDCSRRKAGLPLEPDDIVKGTRPWLRSVVEEPPAAQDPPVQPTRKRPFIYIYDLPPEFNARMLQWRVNRDGCMFRRFHEGNNSYAVTHNLYATEALFHEIMIQSEHRTYDPEEADFFYVPIYITCFIHPVFAWVDHPFYYGPLQLRPLQAANFMAEAQKWIKENHPWWNRRQGRDHIWLALHDEGACWMPTEIYNTSIVLTHWGRLDPVHVSATAYDWDNYSRPVQHDEWQPKDWRGIYEGHACYTPGKDLVIPSYKVPEHYQNSPLMGAPWKKRDILLYFRGDVGVTRLPWYSRQIRQKLYVAAKEKDWVTKYNIRIGFPHDEQVKGNYGEHLSRSKFCLVAPGDGWSGRAEDAVLHGCIPVVIMDNVHAVFESILDWDSFAVRINEKSVLHIPEILLAIPDEKVARMQRRMARVWQRFAWSSGTFLRGLNALTHDRVLSATAGQPTAMTKTEGLRAVKKPWPVQEDAFHTIISWLYSRIADTR